ncbi:MAG: alpha/beta hydrolase, partial [Pseudomonadota bacterium]
QRKRVRDTLRIFEDLCDEKIMLEASKKFVAYSFNSRAKKRALVVHGWMSKSVYMTKVIETLIANDYHVVALDLPGHGGSPSTTLSWKDSVKAILQAQKHFGAFDLALGHSYGGAMILSSTAVKNEVDDIPGILGVKDVVMMASPARIQTAIDLFSGKIGLNDLEKKEFIQLIEKESGAELSKLDGVYLQRTYPTKTKIHCIHDLSDKVIPFEDSDYLSTLGDRVSVIKIKSLGHLKIIYDPYAMSQLDSCLRGLALS